MKMLEVMRGLFRRRMIGSLSVSPVGLVVFCLLVAVAVVIYRNVFEAKEINSYLNAAVLHARPIAEQARLIQERTGKWPASLAEIDAAKADPPPQVGRILLSKDGEVRVVFASPPAIANASLSMKVGVNGGEHFFECRAEGEFKGALPNYCRPGESRPISWPPAFDKPAGKG